MTNKHTGHTKAAITTAIIALAILITGTLFALKATSDDGHCRCGRCHYSCRCCAKYNPKECPRCSHRCGRGN